MKLTSEIRNTIMRRTLEVAVENMRAGRGGPFGAVVAYGGDIIAEAGNEVTLRNDPTAHAEILALRQAGARRGAYDLSGCDLYTSCEPCPMCLSAAYWARVDHVYFANTRADAARIGFDDALIYEEVGRPLEQRRLQSTRLLADEAAAAFDEWAVKSDRIMY